MGLRFNGLIFTVRQKKIISCFTSFSWKFNAESKSEKRFFFKLILRVRAKNLIKNINKLKIGIFYRYLAITLDFNS